MNSTHLNIEHLCHMAKRSVAEEFRGLSLVFITHHNDDREKTINNQREKIGSNAHGRKVFDTLMRYKGKNNSCFAGLIRTEPKGIFSLLQKTEKTALFFINTDEFKVLDNAKTQLYDMLWYALDLTQQSDMRPGRSKAHIQNIDGALMHAQDEMNEAMHNLMADVFTSVYMALQGQSDYIKQLGHKRAQDSVSTRTGKKPEQYPFPIALESTEIIFHDFKKAGKDRPLYHALKMAREVGETHTHDTIKQWWTFCRRAQTMAWNGANAQKNISTAIYSSENTYVKATAYIVAEILGIEPKIITNLTNYNPYTDQDVNAHLHNKQCEKDAEAIAKIAVSPDQDSIFNDHLKRQCEKFIQGDPIGFAPLATLRAKDLYQEQRSDPDLTGHSIRAIYKDEIKETPWIEIEKLMHLCVKAKRSGHDLSIEKIASLMQKSDHFSKHANHVQQALKGEISETEKARIKKENEHALSDDDYLEMPEDIQLNTGEKKNPASS